MEPITYRDAAINDADRIADLFVATFTEIFGHLYRPEDLASFLADHTARKFAAQMADPDYTIRLAELKGALLGYAKLGPLRLPVEAQKPAAELCQLYLLPSARGTGVADALMDWTFAEARARGAETLYLSVFTENHRARAFYARQGFREIGPYAFMVGDHADEDIILARDI
ncbi:GNAT family N-acetyltransferase [Porphyrobacter algicida]|uniref:GNAT family N-acetyltransferase n=1 Tax=Qipengyuania algicida TaxID=1836209 RepID=A0A845AH45_9SPHN|nr:GNAT family N-acetyltransferase [Qipengyuania algicida]MXP28964.1 GNAT family N-acetyltransferase [Qipengyuania algicida]